MNLKTIRIWLLAVFAAVAPIYWIPSTSIGAVLFAKSALLAATLLVCAAAAATIPPKLRSSELALIALVACLCPFMYLIGRLHGDHAAAFHQSYSIGLTLIYLIALTLSIRTEDMSAIRVPILCSFAVYPAISVSMICIGLGIIPDIQVPRELLIANLNAYELVDYGLRGNGLGGSRTGWGVASAVAGGILLCFIGTSSPARSAFFYAIAAITLASLVTAGARGATASFLLGAFWIHYRLSSKLRTVVMAGAAAIILIVWFSSLEADSRFRFASQSVSEHGILDRITSDRYGTWVSGVKNFLQNPLVGAGGEASRSQTGLDVHNAWIGLAEKGGVITFAIGVAILAVLITGCLRPHLRGVPDLSGPVVIGLVLTMVEPGFPFGAFFLSAAFWLVLVFQLKAAAFDSAQRLSFR